MPTPERPISEFRLRDPNTSIQLNGVIMPIKVDAEGYVVDGYHLLAAAKVLGMEQVPYEVRAC